MPALSPSAGAAEGGRPEAASGTERGVIACAAYREGRRVATLAVGEIGEALARQDGFVWLGLYEPEEGLLHEAQRQFGLHDLAVEDAHKAHQRPKLERYGDSLFAVLRTAHLGGDGRVDFGETHIFVSRRYVVTVRHGSLRSHLGVRTRCEAAPQELAKGPGYVLYALMDFVVDQYFPVVEALEEQMDELEDRIFGARFSRETTGRIYELKRDLLATKRALSPLVDISSRLSRAESDPVPEEARVYFRDVHDHVLRIDERLDALRELLATALEANLSLVAVSQNEDVKRLAAWAAIIAVPTMVAGIYGMNFQVLPELQWRYGYPLSLGIMVGLCLLLYWRFKKSGWL